MKDRLSSFVQGVDILTLDPQNLPPIRIIFISFPFVMDYFTFNQIKRWTHFLSHFYFIAIHWVCYCIKVLFREQCRKPANSFFTTECCCSKLFITVRKQQRINEEPYLYKIANPTVFKIERTSIKQLRYKYRIPFLSPQPKLYETQFIMPLWLRAGMQNAEWCILYSTQLCKSECIAEAVGYTTSSRAGASFSTILFAFLDYIWRVQSQSEIYTY